MVVRRRWGDLLKPIKWVSCAFLIGSFPAGAGVFPHYDVGAGGDQDDRVTLMATVDYVGIADVMGGAHPDLIVAFRGDSVLAPNVILGQGNGTRSLSPSQTLSNNPFRFFLNPDEVLLGTIDLNTDGKQDLVFYGSSAVRVIRGRSAWTGDSTRLDADWKVPLSPPPQGSFLSRIGMASADVNGDDREDLVLTWPSNSGVMETLVIFGKEALAETIDPTDPANAQRWLAGVRQMGTTVMDVNRDGRDDLLFGSQDNVTIVYGSTTPRMGWDWAGSTETLKIASGQSGVSLTPEFLTDQNEDGRGDLILRGSGTPATWWWIDGLSINVGTGTIVLSALSPQEVLETGNNQSIRLFSDVDGDTKDDPVAVTSGGTTLFEFFKGGAVSLFPLASSRMSIQTMGDEFVSGGANILSADWDEDGIEDIFIWSSSFINPIVASLNTFFGFLPLENPSLSIVAHNPGAKRAMLGFFVQGEPSEMKLTGHLDDEVAGRWIPFQSQRSVQFTSDPGSKSVTAVYRTLHGRESTPVSTTLTVSAEGPRLRAVTNRLTGTQSPVELDCRVESGPIRAEVFERGGRKVRQLNTPEGQGLLTVRWDGKNDAGEQVRPGVYVVVVDFDGRQEKVNVLLE